MRCQPLPELNDLSTSPSPSVSLRILWPGNGRRNKAIACNINPMQACDQAKVNADMMFRDNLAYSLIFEMERLHMD